MVYTLLILNCLRKGHYHCRHVLIDLMHPHCYVKHRVDVREQNDNLIIQVPNLKLFFINRLIFQGTYIIQVTLQHFNYPWPGEKVLVVDKA